MQRQRIYWELVANPMEIDQSGTKVFPLFPRAFQERRISSIQFHCQLFRLNFWRHLWNFILLSVMRRLLSPDQLQNFCKICSNGQSLTSSHEVDLAERGHPFTLFAVSVLEVQAVSSGHERAVFRVSARRFQWRIWCLKEWGETLWKNPRIFTWSPSEQRVSWICYGCPCKGPAIPYNS